MALTRFLLLALGCVIAVDASAASRYAMLKNRLGLDEKVALAQRAHPPQQKHYQYLNKKTQPYWVNGSALPDVPFDIGESYSGLLPIDHTKELFFWFVPTTNPAAKDEITIWLNGGPGCSSLDGFLHENGPVIWQAGTYRPVKNTYAWSNLTNMVFIEQPVGTGFSQGKPNATNEIDVANQFLPFWKNFMDLFGLQNRKVYVTGESYAGMYCPYIAAAMLDKNDKKYFNVEGLMIYDPSIQYQLASEVSVVPFVDAHIDDFPFNNTFIAFIHNRSAACGYDAYIENALTFPPKGHFVDPPAVNKSDPDGSSIESCQLFTPIFDEIFNINPCFDIYQVGQLCPLLWDVLGFPYSSFYLPKGFSQPYFNRTDVKKAIHAPLSTNWEICANGVFLKPGDTSPPSGINGGPLAQVIQSTNNVIVGHGALDMVLIANGTLLTLNNLTWNGAQGFSRPPTEPFYVPYHDDPVQGSIAGAGVFGGYVTERGLTFVAVSLSGHEVPEYQPSAAYRNLEFLLGRVGSLGEVSPFTTQPGYKQPSAPLGMGTWWP